MSLRRRPETMRRRLVVTASAVLSSARNDSSRHYELILGERIYERLKKATGAQNFSNLLKTIRLSSLSGPPACDTLSSRLRREEWQGGNFRSNVLGGERWCCFR
jgi:hypothetical protein